MTDGGTRDVHPETNKPLHGRGLHRRWEQQPASATGLEPATTGSTVRYSNQLSYAPGWLLAGRYMEKFIQVGRVVKGGQR